MIYTITTTVETDIIWGADQLRQIHRQLQGDILHDLSCGNRHGTGSLQVGDQVIVSITTQEDNGEGAHLVQSEYHELAPKSEWISRISYGVGPLHDSNAYRAFQPRSVADAEAVPAQLELFKSVRRKPTYTEMMAEVVEFCNRG